MRTKAVAIFCLVLFSFGIVVLSQNCSKVSFKSSRTAGGLGDGAGGAGTGDTNPPVTTQPPGDPDDGKEISTAPPLACKRTEVITAAKDALIIIPKRTAEGICYALKIINAARFDTSSTNPTTDRDVISRNHDPGNENHHPYVLGAAKIRLNLQGERLIKISGSNNETTKIQVDNFILIGLYPTSQSGDPSFYSAYGTSDSTMRQTNAVEIFGGNVKVNAFATGGTSTFEPLTLTGRMRFNEEYGLDVRALDCGGTGINTNLYLFFQ